MNELSDLHKALSEAWVAYQRAFYGLKRFDETMLKYGIVNPEGAISEREPLEKQERAAYEEREKAWDAYKNAS